MSAMKHYLYDVIRSNMPEDPQMCLLMEEYLCHLENCHQPLDSAAKMCHYIRVKGNDSNDAQTTP